MTENDKSKAPQSTGTLAWMLPYLAISASLLGFLSWLIGNYLLPQIPFWGHLIAIASALAILAATLYALARAGAAGGDQTTGEG